MQWMFDQVYFDTSPDYHHDRFRGAIFGSLPALWEAYVEGYLCGNIGLASGPQRVLIVRQEDILRNPKDVIGELDRLGLPRNRQSFKNIVQVNRFRICAVHK